MDLGFTAISSVNKDAIRAIEVDDSLVLEVLNRLRADSKLVSWLTEIYQIQRREININQGYLTRGEALLEALKTAMEEGS